MSELTRFRDGRSELNYGIYHDRYQRTPDGWKFTERVHEIRYLDDTPLAGSAPQTAGDAADLLVPHLRISQHQAGCGLRRVPAGLRSQARQ
jgi:hypothetical protein